MNKLVQVKEESKLSNVEKNVYKLHLDNISDGINERNRATSKIVFNVDQILKHKLWREDYNSQEEFVKNVLNLEFSSCTRLIKANKAFLYLSDKTDDENELKTLSNMRENSYRELRRIATDNVKILKIKSESDKEYSDRLLKKESEDLELILNLWNWIYPKIFKYKTDNNVGILPDGGITITAGDITEAAVVLSNLLGNENESKIEIEGKDIATTETITENEEVSIKAIEVLTDLSISERLNEKLQRQKQHIRDKVKNSYYFDRYEGRLEYKNGRLMLINKFVNIDLLEEWSDLIGKETSISIKRPEVKEESS